MSDDKPFAEIKPETSIPDAEGFSVVVEGEELCPPWGNWAESGANDYAAKINAAVTARERKAAAQALRDAADVEDGHAKGWRILLDDYSKRKYAEGINTAILSAQTIEASAMRLRSRADAIEKGGPL